jgi:hypothetical protein
MKSSLAKQALAPLDKETIVKEDVLVTSDFYRVDFSVIVMRPPIHIRMDPLEWEALKLETEMNQKYFSDNLPEPGLIDFKTEFGNLSTNEDDGEPTHYRVLEGEELEAHKADLVSQKEYFKNVALHREKKSDQDDGSKKTRKRKKKVEQGKYYVMYYK